MLSNEQEHGQALIMATLASLALFAMIGLAADLGWDYFSKRKTQAAADAAALAAARSAFDSIGSATATCGGNVVCQQSTSCPGTLPSSPSNAIDVACMYAEQNGYASGGRQTVMVSADTTSPYTTATGPVSVRYWISVQVAESVPQIWSAMFGNTLMTVSSRATAAVGETIFDGNLILLDRENDSAPFGSNGSNMYGVNLLVQANDNKGKDAVQASGILMASNCNGTSLSSTNCTSGNKPGYAGMNQGGGTINSPYTAIRTGGGVTMGGSANWIQPPQNTGAGRPFQDPMSGLGQPPPPTGLSDVPVPGGTIDGSKTPVLYPGNYYAASNSSNCPPSCVASGNPISIKGTVRFAACSGCSAGSAFGKYVIFGGLTSQSPGATVTFDPGEYVFAGAQWQGNNTGMLLDTSTNFTIGDAGADTGELFVFTDLNYPGLQVPGPVQSAASDFQQGQINITSGNNGTNITLHGLNPASPLIPSALAPFVGDLLWQDQANSTVKYTSQGNVDTSCGSLDSPCQRTLTNPTSPQLNLKASPTLNLYGVVYQPRGAWTVITAGSGYSGPLQLITGAVQVQANATLNLTPPTNPIKFVAAGLIE